MHCVDVAYCYRFHTFHDLYVGFTWKVAINVELEKIVVFLVKLINSEICS